MKNVEFYLSFVVSPADDVDGTLMFVERKVSQIQSTERSEVHGRHPSDVAVALYHCQLLRAWCHKIYVKTTRSTENYY